MEVGESGGYLTAPMGRSVARVAPVSFSQLAGVSAGRPGPGHHLSLWCLSGEMVGWKRGRDSSRGMLG